MLFLLWTFTGRDNLRDTEVENLHANRTVIATRDEKVLWLQVAMHDPGCMRLVERSCSLRQDQHDFGCGQSRAFREDVGEIVAAQKFHHEKRRARFRIDVRIERLDDVLTLDVRSHRCFELEAGPHVLVGDETRQHQLQRAVPMGLYVDDLINGTHRARAEATHDLVMAVE